MGVFFLLYRQMRQKQIANSTEIMKQKIDTHTQCINFIDDKIGIVDKKKKKREKTVKSFRIK